MATSARTWFYSHPEPRPYYIEERVNTTLWNNRLQSVHMSCTQAEKPVRMEGMLDGQPITFEWEPGQYFVLKMTEENREIVRLMRQILLGLKPTFAYQAIDGMHVVEWHVDGGEARWRELQGNPAYQGLERLA
jgi:hypothetical protein